MTHDPSRIGGPSSTPDLISRLATDLSPIARPWRPLRAWAAWGLSAVAVATALGGWLPRPDLATQLRSAGFLLELSGCLAIALGAGWAAVRAATPDQHRGPIGRLLVGGVFLGLALIATGSPLDRIGFLTVGANAWWCAVLTMAFATIPGITLLATLRRGAPLDVRVAAALAGAAAAAMAFATMRVACPADEGFHLLVWHELPGAVTIAVAIALGARWLRHWQKPAER